MLVSSSVMETLQYAGRPSIFIELCLAWGGGIRPHTTTLMLPCLGSVATWQACRRARAAEWSMRHTPSPE